MRPRSASQGCPWKERDWMCLSQFPYPLSGSRQLPHSLSLVVDILCFLYLRSYRYALLWSFLCGKLKLKEAFRVSSTYAKPPCLNWRQLLVVLEIAPGTMLPSILPQVISSSEEDVQTSSHTHAWTVSNSCCAWLSALLFHHQCDKEWRSASQSVTFEEEKQTSSQVWCEVMRHLSTLICPFVPDGWSLQ